MLRQAQPSNLLTQYDLLGIIPVAKWDTQWQTGWRKLELNTKSFRSGADSNAIAHKATMTNANILALVSASDTSGWASSASGLWRAPGCMVSAQ